MAILSASSDLTRAALELLYLLIKCTYPTILIALWVIGSAYFIGRPIVDAINSLQSTLSAISIHENEDDLLKRDLGRLNLAEKQYLSSYDFREMVFEELRSELKLGLDEIRDKMRAGLDEVTLERKRDDGGSRGDLRRRLDEMKLKIQGMRSQCRVS